MTKIYFVNYYESKTTNDVTKLRNHCAKLSENAESKHQEELYGRDENG